MKFQVALLTGLLVAAPVLAQGGPTSVGADRGATQKSDVRRTGALNENGERLICRMIQTSSSSRMSARRVCRTEAEWLVIQRSTPQ